jgi:hypothetical protein
MSGIVLISDTHFDNRTGFGKYLTNPEFPGCNNRFHEIVKAFREATAYAIKNDCEAIVLLGDIFHSRGMISIPIYNGVYSLFNEVSKQIPLIIYPGNHDYVDLKALHADKNLHSLFTYEKTVKLYDKASLVQLENFDLGIIPFSPVKDDLLFNAIDLKKNLRKNKANMLCLHHSVAGAVTGPHEWKMPHELQVNEIPEWDYTFCVDTKTEALTKQGWVAYDKLQEGTLIASANDLGVFSWEPIQKMNIFPNYKGDMVHYGGKKHSPLDHFSTPNHTMLIATKNSKNNLVWKKCLAKDVNVMASSRTSSSDWIGTYEAPNLDILKDKNQEDLAELFGWYVSEGTRDKRNFVLCQSKEKNPIKYNQIKDLIIRLGFHASEHKFMIRISSPTLANWFESIFGNGCQNKKLPDWVKNWPKPLLQKLLETMILGDGSTRNKNGGCSTYHTTSSQLATDVQEIALKIGWSVTSHDRMKKNRTKRVWDLTLVKKDIRGLGKYRETIKEYTDLVWCPTVSTGLWFSRRNGRVILTGNSGHYHSHQQIGNLWYVGAPLHHDLGERTYKPGFVHVFPNGSWKHIENKTSPRFVSLETDSHDLISKLDPSNYNVVKWTGEITEGDKLRLNENMVVNNKPSSSKIVSRTSISTTEDPEEMIKKYANAKIKNVEQDLIKYGIKLYKGE